MNRKTNQLQSDTYIYTFAAYFMVYIQNMLSAKLLNLIYLVQYTKTSDSLTHISQSFTNKK